MESIDELKHKVEVLQLKIKIQELEAELSRREALSQPVLLDPNRYIPQPWEITSDYTPPRYQPRPDHIGHTYYKAFGTDDC